MEAFDAYSHAISAIALWSFLCIVLGSIATQGKTAENTCACGHPKQDYDSVAYRRSRAFANAIEMTGPFLGATFAAILIGASPLWVNILASVFLVSRVAMAVVHIGTTIQPLRSLMWIIGTLCVLGLIIMTLLAAFA